MGVGGGGMGGGGGLLHRVVAGQEGLQLLWNKTRLTDGLIGSVEART